MARIVEARARSVAFACTVSLLASSSATLAAPVLYATETFVNQSWLCALDPGTGTPSDIRQINVAGTMAGLAYDPAKDVLYGTAASNLYSIDRSSGTATLIGGMGTDLMLGLAFDSSTQTLYGTYGASAGDGLYSIDAATGAATLVGHTGFFHTDHRNTVTGLAVSPMTGILYGCVAGPAFNWGALIRIDKLAGYGQLVGTYTLPIRGLAFHPVTGVLYGIGAGSLCTIDTFTAAVTVVGPNGFQHPQGLEFVPEPATLSLLALAGLLVARRRT